VRSLAGTHRLCKEWELVDPIFSERDGGDPQKVGLVHVSLSIPISHFCLVGSTPTAQFSLAKSGLYPSLTRISHRLSWEEDGYRTDARAVQRLC